MGSSDSVLHLVVVTGMSGAGRSTALRAREDLGFFCVDNLPPALIPQLVEMRGDGALERVGLGLDVRTGSFLEGAGEVLDALERGGHEVEMVFLEAQAEELMRRFSATRRSHPLAPGGDVPEAIARERERLAPLRARASIIVDTSALSVHELRRRLVEYIARGGKQSRMVTRIVSFGFKFGLPVDADLVFDLRFLPNPYFVPELRPQTGLDEPVSAFVLENTETQELLQALIPLLRNLLPKYEREGKAYLTVAIGCTGGRHRSVAVAERLGAELRADADVVVQHRNVAEGTP